LILVLDLAPGEARAGYTHYWTWKKMPDRAALEACARRIADVVSEAEEFTELLAYNGPADNAPPAAIGKPLPEGTELIVFNGIGDDAHEPFFFPGRLGFNFCKTEAKPYDAAVTAALLVMRDCFPPDVLEIDSDGDWPD